MNFVVRDVFVVYDNAVNREGLCELLRKVRLRIGEW